MAKSKHNSTIDGTYRLVKDNLNSLKQKQSQRDPHKNPASSKRAQQHRGNRHGRSEAARRAVLQAADDLLVEKGFAGVTIEGIAAKAGVGKQTIYRWWASKTDILLDAFLEDAADELTPPDSGELEKDLRLHLKNCAAFLSKSDAGAVYRALVGEAQHDTRLASRLRTQYLNEQRIRDGAPLRRAVERGELPPDMDVTTMAADQLMAPIHYRILVTGESVNTAYTDMLVARLLAQLKR